MRHAQPVAQAAEIAEGMTPTGRLDIHQGNAIPVVSVAHRLARERDEVVLTVSGVCEIASTIVAGDGERFRHGQAAKGGIGLPSSSVQGSFRSATSISVPKIRSGQEG